MTSQPLTHSRARTALFWVTLGVAIGEAILAVIVANTFFVPDLGDSRLPLTLLPIIALVDFVLAIVCLVLGRKANRILGVLALLAVIAQVLIVVWVVVGLSQANFVL